ncbi:glycosyltransferase [Candidatus Dojkabacteria bacterium]|nr:glycosyltransferase [Candidatus Dojkabacteria bacterium]
MFKKRDVVLISSCNYTMHTENVLNAQIITDEIAKSGAKVLFVESLGLKTNPVLGSTGAYKVGKRLLDFANLIFKGLSKPKKNIFVLSLVRLPFENISIIKRINQKLITYFVSKYARKYLREKPILWIFLPTGHFLIDTLDHSVSIYHNVDDYSEVPNVDKKYVLSEQDKILEKADIVFAVSPVTADSFKEKVPPKKVFYLNNVANFSYFNRAVKEKLSIPSDMKPILKEGKPTVGFMGNLASYKENLELLYDVIKDTPKYNYVFLGPVGSGETSTNIEGLKSLSNVYMFGPKPYKTLPSYFKYWDVALIARRRNKANEGGFPLKYFEYLSSGLPVVVTGIQSLKEFSVNPNLGSIADTKSEFINALEYWIKMKSDDPNEWKRRLKERLSIARSNSWEKRMKDFDRIISKYL